MENARENHKEWARKNDDLQHQNSDKNEKEVSMISETGEFPTQKYYASDEDHEDEEETEEETDDANADWGNVDPLSHPGPPSDMDPSAPGSAV